MNYKKIYDNIIQNRIQIPYDGYTETHHIVPRSLGGSNDKTNLVKLSAREHFICHLLLTKIYSPDTISGKKMIKAFIMMLYCKSGSQNRFVSSKDYAVLKQYFSIAQSESQSGSKNSQYGSRWKWIHNDITKEIKKIKINADIPDGWEYGLIFNLNERHALKDNLIQQKQQEKMFLL